MIDEDIKKFASIFDSMVDGVYVVDNDLNVEYMNEAMIKNFGQGIGKKCHHDTTDHRTLPYDDFLDLSNKPLNFLDILMQVRLGEV